jgi:hypothetical protein
MKQHHLSGVSVCVVIIKELIVFGTVIMPSEKLVLCIILYSGCRRILVSSSEQFYFCLAKPLCVNM